MSSWDVPCADPNLFNPDWCSVATGSTVSVVVDCELLTSELLTGVLVPGNRPVRVVGAVDFQVRGCRRLSLFDVLVGSVGTTVDLLITDESVIIAHGIRQSGDLLRVVELWSGLACSSRGLESVGFRHACSVEWRQPLAQLHMTCNPGVPIVHGDINNPSCLKEVMKRVEPPFTLMCGMSCQPYSSGGTQAGSCDERWNTVPATVRACHLFQCPLLIIECVTQARSNQFVTSCLKQLEVQLGYHLTEVTLKLEDVWCARRYRWWLIASHPSIGPVQIPEWPRSLNLNIRDVMPFARQWPADVLQELLLTDHEAAQFTLDGSSLRKYQVKMDGKLPTCLHSWGSQASSRPCGCRTSGFSDQLVRQRGIYAQLVQVMNSEGPVQYRHFHPSELALLNGMPPPESWMTPEHPPLRLCLCAVGQLASPLQSVWVGACIVKHLNAIWNCAQVSPSDLLHGFRSQLFHIAQDMFPNVPVAPVGPMWTCLKYPDGTQVHVQVQSQTTLVELFQAELALTQDAPDGEWFDDVTGAPLDFNAQVGGRCVRVVVKSATAERSASSYSLTHAQLAQIPLDFGDDPSENEVEPEPMPSDVDATMCPEPSTAAVPIHEVAQPSCHSDVSANPGHVMDTLFGLRRLFGIQLAAILPPLVSNQQVCDNYRQVTVHGPSRLEVLANEGCAMGDDELVLHLRACLLLSGRTDVQLLDPLLASSWQKGGSVDDVRAWASQFCDLKSIVTVVHVHDHWMPVVWTLGLCEVRVSMWEHVDADIDCLSPLHGLVSQAFNRPMFSLACTRRSFSRGFCGAAAIAFLSHRLLGKDLPQTEDALGDMHRDLKESFAAACHDVVSLPKPWCWGLGTIDVQSLTVDLLSAHGVPPAQCQMRAKLVVQALGKNEVHAAITGTAPWRSLKALSNQQSPPLQLVLPDELNQHNAKKPASKPKKHARNTPLPARPAELDPAKLVIEHGAFCVGQDEPLPQLSFASVGPLVSGVALTTYSEASHFLQNGKLLTAHGLALLVLNPPQDFHTQLDWMTLRFAARCSVNHEPMLVSGILVQLGQSQVYQYKAKDIPAIMSVEVACARVSVFQDMWEGSWEDFASRPVKHVLGVLPCLHTCRNAEGCSCKSWHPPSDQPHDALLDVFRRQFFTDAGRPTKWEKATHFSVLIRYVKQLETQVLRASGLHGVFIEPKTEDALRPHDDFQVVWLPQMDFAAVAHRAQCEVDCLGVARSGRRFGLRVHVKNFQRVFTSAKPDAVYLAPGNRLSFQCGPWPFGSDRKNIARALKATGWECRPVQPLHHVPGGLMWSVQAIVEPPTNVLSLQHGQVVITGSDAKHAPAEPDTKVVGQATTVALCRPADGAVDPWLAQDPWSKAVTQTAPQPAQQPAPNVLHELEQRLEKTLLDRLPVSDRMEVDGQDQRLQVLEQQVQQLASRQTSLEHTVQDNHQQNTAQVQSLQQQMKVQLDMQSQQMQSMLTDQMTRLEAILAKKPRTE